MLHVIPAVAAPIYNPVSGVQKWCEKSPFLQILANTGYHLGTQGQFCKQ